MLIWSDSLLVQTCIVIKNWIELLNTVKHIVCPWTITSLKSCSSLYVPKTEYCNKLTKHNDCILSFHKIFISLHHMVFLSFIFQYFFQILIKSSCFISVLSIIWKIFESRTVWVNPYCTFRKNWSTFIKKV